MPKVCTIVSCAVRYWTLLALGVTISVGLNASAALAQDVDPEAGDVVLEEEALEEEATPSSTSPSAIQPNPEPKVPAITPETEQVTPTNYNPFRIGMGLNTSVGQGTFVANEYARNSYVGWGFSLTPSYRFNEGPFDMPAPTVSATASITQELTDSDGDTRNQRVLFGDIRLGMSQPLTVIEDTVFLGSSLNLFLPTSLPSQFAGLYFGASLGLNVGASFGPLNIGYSASFRKNFHDATSPSIDDPYLDRYYGTDYPSIINRSTTNTNYDTAANVGFEGGVLSDGVIFSSHALSHGINVSYNVLPTWTFSVSYTLRHGWSYADYEVDELSSQYATDENQSDSFATSISTTYAFDLLNVSLGIATSGPVWDARNDNLRFPFWDFESHASNLSTIFLSVGSALNITTDGVYIGRQLTDQELREEQAAQVTEKKKKQ